MDYDVKQLIRQLCSGDDETINIAAEILCQEKIKEAMRPLLALTYHHNPIVRGIAALCLGVFGDERSEKFLERLKTLDRDKNVRLAAFLALKHFGAISFERIKSEMHSYVNFSMREIFPHKYEPAQGGKHPSIFSRIPCLGLFSFYSLKTQISIIGGGITILGIFFYAIYGGGSLFQKAIKPLEDSKKASLTELLALRSKEIVSFRTRYLNPENPEGQLPKTIQLTTYGDVLKDIIDQVYDDPHFTKAGKNTLHATWLKINYGATSIDKDDSLFFETSRNDRLIFPNLPAMHIEYELSNGTIAYHAIEQPDPEVSISVTVERASDTEGSTLTLTLRNQGKSWKKLILKEGRILEMEGSEGSQYQSIIITQGGGVIILPPRQSAQRMIKGFCMQKGFRLPPKGARLVYTPFLIKNELVNKTQEELYRIVETPAPNRSRVTAKGYSSQENGKSEQGRDEAFRNTILNAARQAGVDITAEVINQNLSYIKEHQRLSTQKYSVRLIKIIQEEYLQQESKYLFTGEFEVQSGVPRPELQLH